MTRRKTFVSPSFNKISETDEQIIPLAENLPSLYFSLASALSLASKYQTVMAYLHEPDKNI